MNGGRRRHSLHTRDDRGTQAQRRPDGLAFADALECRALCEDHDLSGTLLMKSRVRPGCFKVTGAKWFRAVQPGPALWLWELDTLCLSLHIPQRVRP